MQTHATRPRTRIETSVFADDGSIPNNPALPLVVYRAGIDFSGTAEPVALIEATFTSNGWVDLWRNGIFPYVHYHSAIHEVLGIGRGRARVRFGGKTGIDLELASGDVVVLPAGTGHQGLVVSADLVIVGAYPPAGRFDVCLGSQAERRRAHVSIPQVPLPLTDPVFGTGGPLLELWSVPSSPETAPR